MFVACVDAFPLHRFSARGRGSWTIATAVRGATGAPADCTRGQGRAVEKSISHAKDLPHHSHDSQQYWNT